MGKLPATPLDCLVPQMSAVYVLCSFAGYKHCVTAPVTKPGAVGGALRVLDYLIPQYLGYKLHFCVPS